MNEKTADAVNAPTDEVRTITPAPVPAAPLRPSRLYRCYGCRNAKNGALGLDFTSDAKLEEVKCPICGIKKSCRTVGHHIEPLVVMHFEPPYPHPEIGKTTGIGHVACDPTLKTGLGNCRYTGERSVVNCPACQASEAFVNGEAGAFDPRFDLPLNKDGIRMPDAKGGG